MEYRYGMRLRGYAPLCQPKEGLLRREDDTTGKYHDILVYNRQLTQDEIRSYELDDLGRKYPQVILEVLSKSMDYSIDDSHLETLSPNEVFDCVCTWEGLINYGSTIRRWIKNIYGIDLDKVSEERSKLL
jgi:hypothetical protein